MEIFSEDKLKNLMCFIWPCQIWPLFLFQPHLFLFSLILQASLLASTMFPYFRVFVAIVSWLTSIHLPPKIFNHLIWETFPNILIFSRCLFCVLSLHPITLTILYIFFVTQGSTFSLMVRIMSFIVSSELANRIIPIQH